MNKKITKPKGNIIVGLGFDPAEATVLLMRADLMSDLRLSLHQKRTGLLDLMQPNASALQSGISDGGL
jgi:hypothetical protein